MEPAKQYDHVVAGVTADGIVDIESLCSKINDKTVMVSIMYANNEVGTIQPIRQITLMLEKIRSERRVSGNSLPLYFHTDACQAANYLDLHVSRLGVDLMTLNGGKIYGPKQSGVLFVSHTVRLQPVIRGGGQERNIRSGTENVPGCIGFAKALQLAQSGRHEESVRLLELQNLFFALVSEKLPNVVINGSRKHRLPNNIHITFPGQDNERLLVELDERGILAAAGSACSASDDEPSHVLRAMGASDTDARSSLRITTGRGTAEADICALADVLSVLAT